MDFLPPLACMAGLLVAFWFYLMGLILGLRTPDAAASSIPIVPRRPES